MNTTIRTPDDIPDDIFRRLQALAEPFVDRTPWAVIERLLDEHDKTLAQREVGGLRNIQESSPQVQTFQREHSSTNQVQVFAPKLFLAPASGSNVDVSLRRWLKLRHWERYLTQTQIEQLRDTLGERARFKCWAMTSKRRSLFEAMQVGDWVLFCEKGTHLFGLRGRVLTKLESKDLGNALWPVTPGGGGSWDLIYIVDQVESVRIPKERLLQALGYDSTYRLPGINRVSTERLGPAVSRYSGGLEEMLQVLDGLK